MTRSGMKVISKDGVDYPIYLGREFMNSDLTALNLSVRSYNGLRRAGWKTVEDLVCHIESDRDLGRIRNLGKTSIQEIMTKLLEFHLSRLSTGEKGIYQQKFNILNDEEMQKKDNSHPVQESSIDYIPCNSSNTPVVMFSDVPAGEYSRLKMIYAEAGISIKEPHVGVLSFPIYKKLLNADIEELELSTRPYNALRRMGVEKILDIPHSSELRKIRNLGDNSIFEILDRLFEYQYRKIEENKRYEYLLIVKNGYESQFEVLK